MLRNIMLVLGVVSILSGALVFCIDVVFGGHILLNYTGTLASKGYLGHAVIFWAFPIIAGLALILSVKKGGKK